MAKEVVIIGAGGHAKVIADIVEKTSDLVYGFLDDNLEKGTTLVGNEDFKIIGNLNDIGFIHSANKELEFIIAIGDNKKRKEIVEKNNKDIKYYTAIHPSASIGLDVEINEGTVIMANACINSSAKVGKHSIINTAAVIEHDNKIEDYVHISPNATLCGTVSVGELTHIGAGAVVRNNIAICSNSTIGMGAIVIKDIKEEGTYIGIPAKKMKG